MNKVKKKRLLEAAKRLRNLERDIKIAWVFCCVPWVAICLVLVLNRSS